MSKEEIKVGDCFKHKESGELIAMVNDRNQSRNFYDVLVVTPKEIRIDDYHGHFLLQRCTPITFAEFEAALDATFATIKAELPEAK